METREVPIEQAVGLTLAHDLTRITPGKSKGAVLRRGHMIDTDDLELLREIGKSRINVLELAPDEVHEDDAAEELALMLAGRGVHLRLPGEAWADLLASSTGLLKVDRERLLEVNLTDGLLVATRHDNSPVRAGDTVAKAKIRDLAVRRAVLETAREVTAGSPPVVEVLPYREVRAEAVITGREVYEGRVKDAFGPLLRRRLEEYGSTLDHTEIVPDEAPLIERAVRAALDRGVDMVFVTGGGSPDDCTSEAIARCADEVAFHGAPASPGAMTALAYAGGVPIVGVPAGLLAWPRGFVDVILPRLLVGERLTRVDAAQYGHGALCLHCERCVFPDCPFGV